MTLEAVTRILAKSPDGFDEAAHPGWPKPVFADRGAYWEASWPPPARPGAVITTNGGFRLDIDKCSGEIRNRQAWK
jgi:hypothetical protein